MVRGRRGLAAGVLLALVAACGGDDGSDGDGEAATTTSTTAATTTGPEETTTTTAPVDLDRKPVVAGSPEEVAAQIEEAETGIRDPSADGDRLAWLGHLQQVAYRTLADNPGWDEQVLALLPEALRAGVRENVAANRELRSLVRNPRPELPAWRIVPAAPMDELRGYYEAGEAEFGVPWQYLAAVHLVETRMGRLRGVSTAGARGPMQFIPSTWEAYGEGDIESDRDSIRAAARYLAANGGADPARRDDALYRYNPTPKYVNAVRAYAEQMVADETAYRGYYHWQVYYWSTLGDVWLMEGYERDSTRPVESGDLEGTRG
jgi:soluble lytic murein transglycosylase-like protein